MGWVTLHPGSIHASAEACFLCDAGNNVASRSAENICVLVNVVKSDYIWSTQPGKGMQCAPLISFIHLFITLRLLHRVPRIAADIMHEVEYTSQS